MNLAIFGIGAMGCLFGARLSRHASVTLIGRWPEQVAALRHAPLRIERANADPYEASLTVLDPDDLEQSAFDIALILTKAAGTDRAARLAAQALKPDGLAVTLQNGIGNLEMIAAHVGEDRAVLGTTTEGAAMLAPGLLREGGAGVTHLSTRPSIHARIEALAGLLERGGFNTELTDDVRGLVWGKLAINAALNPLTALLRVPNGALPDIDHARALMSDAACEVAAVAAAQGIALPFPDPAARAIEVARLTDVNRSSMLQDVLRGAETEIEAICGAVMREGARLGVPAPTNALLYQLVKAMEKAYPQRVT